MTESSAFSSIGSKSINDQDMADGFGGLLEGINQLISATQHAHSKIADELGFPLQQMTDNHHAQLVQNLSVFANRMGQACSNRSYGMQRLEPCEAAKFAGESSGPMIEKLVLLHELSAKHARAFVRIAQSQNDNETAALMDECITFHVTFAWMLRALLR